MYPDDEKSLLQADDQKLQTDLDTTKEQLSEIREEANSEAKLDKEENAFSEKKVETIAIPDSEIDKDLYNEVLEKLDIKTKEKQQDVQEKSMQEKLSKETYLNRIGDLEKSQTKLEIEKVISQDFSKIQVLVKAGLISSVQGQNLKKQVLKKAFDGLVQAEKIKRALSPALNQGKLVEKPVKNDEVFEEFSKSDPDFFSSVGRKEVLNYLKSSDVIFEKDELNKISEIIRIVEKGAIDRYLQKVAHEKTLRDSNETVKQRLTANAQRSGLSGDFLRTFTREQIGKMNSAEFTKYEAAIMEALKKGLIK